MKKILSASLAYSGIILGGAFANPDNFLFTKDPIFSVNVSGGAAANWIFGSLNNRDTYLFPAKQRGGVVPQNAPAEYTYGKPDVIRPKTDNFLMTFEKFDLGFEVKGDVSEDVEVGLYLGLSNQSSDDQLNFWERYISLKCPFGKIVLGSTDGADAVFRVGPRGMQVGVAGLSSVQWNRLGQATTGVERGFYLGGKIAGNGNSDGNKILYLTPDINSSPFSGVNLAISFTADANHMGALSLDNSKVQSLGSPYQANVLAIGLRYHKELMKGLTFATSLSGVKGHVRAEDVAGLLADQSLEREPLFAVGIGCQFSYEGFQVGYEFLNNMRSGVLKRDSTVGVDPFVDGISNPKNYIASEAHGALVHGIGSCFDFGDLKISGGYYYSYRNTGFFENGAESAGQAVARCINLGAEYAVYKGVSLYAEYGHHDQNNPDALHEARFIGQNAATGVMKGVASGVDHIVMCGLRMKF